MRRPTPILPPALRTTFAGRQARAPERVAAAARYSPRRRRIGERCREGQELYHDMKQAGVLPAAGPKSRAG